jgi:hypothetical protein
MLTEIGYRTPHPGAVDDDNAIRMHRQAAVHAMTSSLMRAGYQALESARLARTDVNAITISHEFSPALMVNLSFLTVRERLHASGFFA